MTVRDITVLGTSSQAPTRTRNHGAYLLRWNLEGLLFDPGEGTQRQFIFADIAPPTVNRIFISHFHGDHCLGLGSMLMRLNLDRVNHPIHCYYPASGKKYFDRLRFGTIYHETIEVIEHPVSEAGVVEDNEHFRIEAAFLEHGPVDNLGWRITEPDRRKYCKEKLQSFGIRGPAVKQLEREGFIEINGQRITLDEVSWIHKGDSLAVVIDTVPCKAAQHLAHGAKLLICESTYIDEHRDLARKHNHMTAKQAATLAKEAGVEYLILTHFSARYQDTSVFQEEAQKVFPNVWLGEDLKRYPFPR